LTRVLRHRLRDGVVEAEIKRLKLLPGDRRLLLNGHLGYRLTDISVVVNDLRDGEPHAKQVVTVTAGALANLLVVNDVARSCQAQRVNELVQEHRDAVLELRLAWFRTRP
jgi:hypothetical protein